MDVAVLSLSRASAPPFRRRCGSTFSSGSSSEPWQSSRDTRAPPQRPGGSPDRPERFSGKHMGRLRRRSHSSTVMQGRSDAVLQKRISSIRWIMCLRWCMRGNLSRQRLNCSSLPFQTCSLTTVNVWLLEPKVHWHLSFFFSNVLFLIFQSFKTHF